MKIPTIILALLCFVITPIKPATAENPYKEFLNLYDALLKEHIAPSRRQGIEYNGVNYDGWSKDKRHKQALNLILTTPPENKMAYWINVYNFLTIDLIVKTGERETIRNLGGFLTSPWKHNTWRINGEEYTLHQIEHDILRPMGEARIHFAINCAAISCPDLRSEAYRNEQLETQLTEQTLLTLKNKSKGLKRENNTVYVSKIFDWFAEDFKNGDVKAWLAEHKALESSYNLEYMPYNWSLNTTKQ